MELQVPAAVQLPGDSPSKQVHSQGFRNKGRGHSSHDGLLQKQIVKRGKKNEAGFRSVVYPPFPFFFKSQAERKCGGRFPLVCKIEQLVLEKLKQGVGLCCVTGAVALTEMKARWLFPGDDDNDEQDLSLLIIIIIILCIPIIIIALIISMCLLSGRWSGRGSCPAGTPSGDPRRRRRRTRRRTCAR